jgi:hypothetical protein
MILPKKEIEILTQWMPEKLEGKKEKGLIKERRQVETKRIREN